MRTLCIMGTRGVPAAHGGFETFAEQLSCYLAGRGWRVTVYCQEDGDGPVREDTWQGVHRVIIPVARGGAAGTVVFDWLSTRHAIRAGHPLLLTLGYNTALFCLAYRLAGRSNLINMDGIEWRRDKWGKFAKTWLWLNERFGCWFGTHLVADHPEIARHLATRIPAGKITMIPYGAPRIDAADPAAIAALGLTPGRYIVLIARAEPENSVREVVAAFSRRHRGLTLVVLGNYTPETNAYHAAVLAVAGSEVVFPGAIYDARVVESLRFHALFHVHGHRVGGTNPSLVEALGAGNAVLAHDNPFNRWVAADAAVYFTDEDSCAEQLDRLAGDAGLLERLRAAGRRQHENHFTWPRVLAAYEQLLSTY